MRKETKIGEALFTKKNDPDFAQNTDTAAWERVTLPHTWNNLDGQDGGGDYYRGACWYKLALPVPTQGLCQYIQFEGANHVAQVWCNGVYLGEHKGGFSTFRFDITKHLKADGNELTLCVENGKDNHVYPQQADFTFCGGLYRAVTLAEVSPIHFDLMKHGSQGVFVTPKTDSGIAVIRVDAFAVGKLADTQVLCRILDAQESTVAETKAAASDHNEITLEFSAPHLWNGRVDPYLYIAELTLSENGNAVDTVRIPFGIRDFCVDASEGFFLNGTHFPLRGVSRHQDRHDKGWALSEADHDEDMALICEVGATSIRLAHYQHAQYFYDLCDRKGMVLWAEIPFITIFDDAPEAREDTLLQMTELIVQNYNHPAICFWGISNEITISGESPALLDNLKALEVLVKQLDPTRLSTMAQLSTVPLDSAHNQITDVLAYNHYFGWYGGSVDQNGPWLDNFHAQYPERPLGLSEYGAECVKGWHSAAPRVKDYTEEYQAYYHEEMLKAFSTRPYIWGTYVWNMFDFAADARDEGGSRGMNNKGLVTYDRMMKKDAFYAYKAWWSDDPFLHISGRRFVDRDGGTTEIKVYSNQKEITLSVNGQTVGSCKEGPVFLFENVALKSGENTIMATAPSGLSDTIVLNGVTEPNKSYILPQEETSEAVRNWFESLTTETTELRYPEGCYSVQDSLGVLLENPETAEMVKNVMEAAMGRATMQMSTNMGKGKSGVLGDMTVDMLILMGGEKLPANTKVMLNEKLIQVKKNIK